MMGNGLGTRGRPHLLVGGGSVEEALLHRPDRRQHQQPGNAPQGPRRAGARRRLLARRLGSVVDLLPAAARLRTPEWKGR